METVFEIKPIGIIRTPYVSSAPYQPVENANEGDFYLVVNPEYANGLYKLESFKYIYVIYFLNRIDREPSMIVSPPWSNGKRVGLFASRSPLRPNPIGISVVELKGINDNIVYISSLDAFDKTPLIDIKPYIKDLDTKEDANHGWVDDLEDKEHLILHIKGIPHDY
ncbi:MAG TPA: tRNA (N6-threonylcarbamoyladenosine(37)-N6)-methyltransferase TrmO [Thermotogaceae bacterium]|nr:tRNA (N6-threonylcarbamoyladenosine(37)-N6)-methyltransferase TrmO [Thermotogota bacterium]HEW91530.1 tRNA (N6-threonylcarbamoyladenosine(37)-N6)-methyltransferase TrmO [Thermotogaceae bacterium]